MARTTLDQAQGWLERTKLTLSEFDVALLSQVEAQVLARVSMAYDTSTWVDTTTTPVLVQSVIAMVYAARFYNRQYSEDQDTSTYADKLLLIAESNILGIIDGTFDLIEIPGNVASAAGPAYYPTDASSLLEPTDLDPSLGEAKFTMSRVF